MHVLVVGAGLAGLATAWSLLSAGVSVSLIDSARDLARGAARYSGGYIGPAGLRPFVRPLSFSDRSWMRFSSAKPSSPVRYSVSERSRWREFSYEYVEGCTLERVGAARRMLRTMGAVNGRLLGRLEGELGFDTGRRNVLHLFPSQSRWDLARLRPSEYLNTSAGIERFSPDDARSMEPLIDKSASLAGALFSPDDRTIDAAVLCRSLAGLCTAVGADFRPATPALEILVRDGHVRGVQTAGMEIAADAVVLACGLGAMGLLRRSRIAIRIPAAPMTLCSVTAEVRARGGGASASIIDEVNCVLFTSLGRRVRASGSPFLGDPPEGTLAAEQKRLIDCGTAIYDSDVDFEAGLFRTATVMSLPDGLPMLGMAAGAEGLYFNIGHGVNGVTTALPCSRFLAAMILGSVPETDLGPLSPERFTRG